MRQSWRVGTIALALGLALVSLTATSALAGPYSRLQVLLPGETAAPGTTSGKTGSPRAQTAGVPFDVTVRGCDAQWNTVPTTTNVIGLLSSDVSATLPGPTQLVSGTVSFTVVLNAGGSFTIYAHDQTDATIPDGTSASVATLVLQGFQFSSITQKNQTAGTPLTVTLTARDPGGSVVTGYNGPVQLKEITSFGDGRTSPATVTLTNGSWTGPLTPYRVDESSINRGNANFYAWIANAPAKNGTSDPFTVHPAPFARMQIVVPGQTPAPGSISGVLGTPAGQAAGRAFTVQVYATDNYWNQLPNADVARITSGDLAMTPVSGTLSNGAGSFSVTLNTVGTQTLTVSDQSRSGITPMTSAGIAVTPSAADHFAIGTLPSPVTAGTSVTVTIRAVDVSNNTVPNYDGDALLTANTGAGSISPESITFTNGVWTGSMTFRGAGGSVGITVSDYSAPPRTGTSNRIVVQAGPFAGVQVLLPGESAQGGTADGKSGVPLVQAAGTPFTLTVRAVDAWSNLVSGVNDHIALGSTDAFAAMPAETTLANGQLLMPIRLFRSGVQRIWASDVDQPSASADTSSDVTVTGGAFAKVLVLAPGESPAPGTVSGRTGTATDQSINYAFTVTVMATDAWWNPVGGVTDVVRLTSSDPMATLPADAPLVDGQVQLAMRLATGGFQQIGVVDVTQPSKTGGSTQVRAINSGFHLEAAVTPASASAGDAFTLTVKVTNDAGSVIQEVNSAVTIEVRNANTNGPGRGALLTTQFQLLQGQRAVSETYTFAEPIVLIAHDDAGNAPGITNPIVIVPGPPTTIHLTSDPAWVGGNRHATLSARLVDAYENGVPDHAMAFAVVTGAGSLTAIDSVTDSTGNARADFLSGRQPEKGRVHASSGALGADLDLETAFVDPNAAGGTMTNYPNPFHPPLEGTTLAWKISDDATVTLRIFTTSGDLVRREVFDRGGVGGTSGLNTWSWDGRNGKGDVVASGGYVVLVEAQGQGATLHVIRRKIAVVR